MSDNKNNNSFPENDPQKVPDNNFPKQDEGKNKISRRKVVKALAGLPVIGLFGYQVLRKRSYDQMKREAIIKELGLDQIDFPASDYGRNNPGGDLIRVGFIGFGARSNALANSLGFMHPDTVKTRNDRGTLNEWLQQENLNVAITGICDVFDMHAENGLATARNEIRPGGQDAPKIPVKRYHDYREMLQDKDIDAVIIGTPDHHHGQMTIDAAKAGKHIYCEKSVANTEKEINELYAAVKASGVVYQLGHQITQNVVYQQAREILKREMLGKVNLVQTTSNRNTSHGAWVRHLDGQGNPRPGDETTIDWKQWLGNAPLTPFSINRYYNWTLYFDYATGLIGQLYTHEFDAMNQILNLGIPKSVTSSGGIYRWKDGRDMADMLHIVSEYPDRDLTLLYSGNLASSLGRGRVIMGTDASMEIGNNITINADRNSVRYQKGIQSGLIDPGSPMISFNPASGHIDAVTSASERYYASRGLTTTTINGRNVDVTHLHIREWIHSIRNGSIPSVNIDVAYDEGMACVMAQRAYVEQRMVQWDEVNRKIV
jgi:predicted dehydrogenase